VITPVNQQPQRSVHDDDEYRRNYTATEYINALFALNNNWVGQGVLVGVMDDGVMEVGDLQGQIDRQLSRDFGFDTDIGGVITNRSGDARVGDQYSEHGTSVAAIIAGRNDGQGVQGFAPGARIVSLRVDGRVQTEGTNGPVFGTVSGLDGHLAVRYAADNRIPLINMSLARANPENGPNTAFRSAVIYYHDVAKGLLVAANGNGGGANPRNFVDMAPEAQQSWLFVGALETDGRSYDIASYSERCGVAMNRCVVAPGRNITMNIAGEVEGFQGTSSATPVVTSVAAMILSKWPQLTGVDAGNIILNSARDIGAPGTDEIYGRGLVDAQAALLPVNPQLSNNVISGSLTNAGMIVGSAFGYNGASIKQALNEVTVLDSYGRDYTGNISGMVFVPDENPGAGMQRRVEAMANARSAGFVSPAGSAGIGVTAFDTGLRDAFGVPVLRNELTNAQVALPLTDKLSITGGFNSANNVSNDIMGLAPTSDAMFAYSPLAQTSAGVSYRLGKGKLAMLAYTGGEDDLQVNGATLQYGLGASSLKLGLVRENGSVFGTPTGLGMLRFGDGARTYFVEAASGFDVGKWSFNGFASLGATRLRLAKDMLMTDADTITTGRFSLIASRPALDGRISFGLAQQLVALGGDATFTVGSGYSLDVRGLLFQDRRVDLAGQIAPQFTIGYERRGERSDFQVGAASDAQARDVRGVAAWSIAF